MRLTGKEYDGELSWNHKFVWEKRMIEYFKQETKLNKNYQKAYALIFEQCTKNMR